MTRSESRELAFAIGFERIITKESVDKIIEGAMEIREEKISDFARQLALGVESNETEIDELIDKNSRYWRVDRISKPALSVLRLALYEMIYENDIPHSVSINEAVELTKKYGDTDDFKFVNGVLSAANKRMESKDE